MSPLPVRERNRRLRGLGLSRRDPDDTVTEALRIVQHYQSWIRGRWARSDVDVTHVRSRGAFAGDFWNVVPLLHKDHQRLHRIGRAAYEREHECDLDKWARELTVQYLGGHPTEAAWLLKHAPAFK